jgi:transcriptional regulator with XRE-family HTH domain
MAKSNFKDNLRRYRDINQLTQIKLAGILSMGRAKLGSYEEGRAEPSIGDFYVMCEKMKITDPQGFYSNENYFDNVPLVSGQRMRLLCSNIVHNFTQIEECIEKLKPMIHENQ